MIKIENLTFQYERGNKNALEKINLEIPKGGFFGIIGPSGAGKTTLTQAINGIIPHYYKGDYYGKVIVNSTDVFDAGLTDLSRFVGSVFQDIDSQMVATVVEDEILYGLENFGVDHSEIEARVCEALEMVGISNLRYRNIASLSGGQKQKVAIAAILALKPEVLVLDEPTGELDPVSSRQIFTLLRKLNEEQGMTIIVVEQKIMLLCEFAKQLGVLSEGKFLYQGSVEDVLAHSKELEAIGVQCPRVISMVNAAKEAGVPLDFCINTDQAKASIEKLVGSVSAPAAAPVLSEKEVVADPIIDFNDVSFHYVIDGPTLNHLDFKIGKGEMVALIGENGAGKSTTSKLMNGLLKPVSGTVTIMGQDTKSVRTSILAKNIGFLFQNPDRQLCQNTVREEVLFSMRLVSSLDPKEQEKKTDAIIAKMGLPADADPFLLSRGERQRVALASVLVTEPDILILDEPTTGLDYKECIQIMEQVKALNEEKQVTVLMVCHDMEIVLDYAKRVIVLANGGIQADGKAEEVFRMKDIIRKACVLPPQMIALAEDLDDRFAKVNNVDDMIEVLSSVYKKGGNV